MNTCISNKNFLEADRTLTRINQLKKLIINKESSSKKRIYKQQHNVIKHNQLIQTKKFNKEWDETYKTRVNVEKSIIHFKDSFCVAKRKTTNEKTIHADLLLAGISQLLTVVVADKINQRDHIRSLKSYIA